MSRGLGVQQRLVLDALHALEIKHGAGRWFYTHAVIRECWPGNAGDAPTKASLLRARRDTEAALNPSRIFAALARRGLIKRNPRRGIGASIRLTPKGTQCNPNA
jgi:hypothetical protein